MLLNPSLTIDCAGCPDLELGVFIITGVPIDGAISAKRRSD